MGNVAAITDGATNQGQRGNRTMTYDGLDRLTDAVSPMYGSAGTHYTYDVLDNLVHTIAPGRDQWLCYYQFNRLSNVKDGGDCSTGNTILGLGYDAQGNLNNWNGKVHNFDYGNRLRSVTDVESYRYDAHGRRIRAWTPSAGLLYSLYSQAGQLLWQHDSRTSKRREYVYLNGSLVAERTRPIGSTAETITYQHTDALGTPVVKTSASRVILERREYEPYGKLLNQPLASGPGFTGHDTDPDTQYTYMQQRYYDPRVGRFWSVDPVTVDSAGGNFNRYWYANNNPYRFTDPDGRFADTLVDAAFTLCDAGRFLGAATAAAVGVATNDAALETVGLEGMRETGVDLGGSVVSAVIPGLSAPITRTGLRTADEAIAAANVVKKAGNLHASGGREAAKALFRKADVAGKGNRIIMRDQTGGGRQVRGMTSDGKAMTIRFKKDGTTRLEFGDRARKDGKIIFEAVEHVRD